LVAHFVASSPEPPAAIVLDLDPTDDPTHGQQELTFYNPYEKHYCYWPLLIFEGLAGALVTACLRPGTRPTGVENAMILGRLLACLRRHWPRPHILVRGDSHCATPAVLEVRAHRHRIDFGFGLAGNAVLLRSAEPVMQEARRLHPQRTARAWAQRARPPARSRLYEALTYAAAAWSQPWRVLLKAEVLAAGDHQRFVVTSLVAPTPPRVYEEVYGARGKCENDSKAVQGDLPSDRTSAPTFLATAMRRLLSWAADVLHQALRTQTLQQTTLAQAQPSTVILTRCKVATQVKPYKAHLLLHLPSSCPVQALLPRVTALLSLVPLPVVNTS
jgi:Transposase DDE domain group 1